MATRLHTFIAAFVAVTVISSAGIPPTAQATPDEGTIRITLTRDGEVVAVEGRGHSTGLWNRGVSLPELKGKGKLLKTIRLYRHNDDNHDLINPDGSDTHSHTGPADAPWNTHQHCILWLDDNDFILVHC